MPQDAINEAGKVMGANLEDIAKKSFPVDTESKQDVPEEHFVALTKAGSDQKKGMMGMSPDASIGRTQKVDLKIAIGNRIEYFELTESTVWEKNHHGISNTPIMSEAEAQTLGDDEIINKTRDYFNKQIYTKYNPDIKRLKKMAAKSLGKSESDLTAKDIRGLGSVEQIQGVLKVKGTTDRISKSVVSIILHAIGNIGPYTAGVANTMKVRDGTYVAAPLQILDKPPNARFLFKHPIDEPWVTHGPSFIIGELRQAGILNTMTYASTHRRQAASHLAQISGNTDDKMSIGTATNLALGDLANTSGTEFSQTVSMITDVKQSKVIEDFVKRLQKGDPAATSEVTNALQQYADGPVHPPQRLRAKLQAKHLMKLGVASAVGGAAFGLGKMVFDMASSSPVNSYWDNKYSFWATPYMGVSTRGK